MVLLSVQTVSIAWSPDVALGIRNLVYSLPFVFFGLVARYLAREKPFELQSIVKIYCIVALIEPALCILFRLSPPVERAFLTSQVVTHFMNSNSMATLVSSGTISVMDPEKAGGFLLNGNVAAAWCFVNACLAFCMVSYTSKKNAWKGVAAFYAAAILFTGSKAGFALLLVAPASGWMAWKFFSRRPTASDVLVVLVGLGLLFAFAQLVQSWLPESEFGQRSAMALQTRQLIWSRAAVAFQEHPFLGQGFGGWRRDFMAFGAAARSAGLGIGEFPAHNTFIILWSQSGLVALVAGVWLTVAVYADVLGGMSRGRRLISAAAFAAWTWIVLHGLGENFGLLGDPHFQVPLAVLIGWASAGPAAFGDSSKSSGVHS
ncbi:O-antigen ligase family protein [Caulobacter segnis]